MKSHKIIWISYLLFLTRHLACAEEKSLSYFQDDKQYFSVGYGYLSYYKLFSRSPQNAQDYKVVDKVALFLKYDKSIYGRLTAGLNLSYAKQTITYSTNDSLTNLNPAEINRDAVNLLFRLNLYFYDKKYLNIYSGVGLGLRYVHKKYNSSIARDNDSQMMFPFTGEFTIGARFMPSDDFHFFVETGFAQSLFQAGVVLAIHGTSSHIDGSLF